MAYIFSLNYTRLFNDPVKHTERKMFGGPYHSVVKHMPEQYRMVSLRSTVAEAAERMFSELRYIM